MSLGSKSGSIYNHYSSKYYYFHAQVNLNKSLRQIRRKTDSLLDWLGDWGGLMDGLHFIGDLFIHFYQEYALKASLVSLLINFSPSSKTGAKSLF